MTTDTAQRQIDSFRSLSDTLETLSFEGCIVYNPLTYALEPLKEYTRRYGNTPKRVLFMGMNPGPWGMAQTGIPFGEVHTVKEWLQITAPIGTPKIIHPKRPVLGTSCTRSEVSGQRLWGLFRERYIQPQDFFREHLVINYCPLLFIGSSGKDGSGARNITPDKLKPRERDALLSLCDQHLREMAEILRPDFLVGVGQFAAKRAREALNGAIPVTCILHPSPANPRSNGGAWKETAARQMIESGIWKP